MDSYKNCDNHDQVAVIMVPFPAQGHLNQLLQLSCLLSSYGLPIHFIGSATHNQQAKIRANGLNLIDMSKIQFHDLPTPVFPSSPADHNASIKTLAHLQASWDASVHLRGPIAAKLQEISSIVRRIVIIHDPLMAYNVVDATSISNAETYVFNCLPVFTKFVITWEGLGKPFQIEDQEELKLKDLPSMEGTMTDELERFVTFQFGYLNNSSGEIHNTSRVIENRFIDLYSREEIVQNKKQWAIGPILPVKKVSHIIKKQHFCLEWLDKHPPRSVLYISFGTTTSLSDEEIKNLAMGLEQSKQRFIWVLREADKADIFNGDQERKAELPKWFEDRTKGVGLVLRSWAPQPEILAHSSTGGFMSHCGWNSVLESLTMGVPIAAWPMHSDQPRNAFFVTEILKVGLIVREWANRDKVMDSSKIESVVRRLMDSEEGDEMRKRAAEIGDGVRKGTENGGVSKMEIESFISHITR